MAKKTVLACRCGEVRFEASGLPIVTATCHCHSCQEAGAQFAALPGAPQVLDSDGGTEFALFRKDRVVCVRGEVLLRSHRLTPRATTRRVLARCCDTPMFLEFKGGHWLSLYRRCFGASAPAIEMRVMTADRREGVTFTDDVPSYNTHSVKFMWRLFAAWVRMGFRIPALRPIADA